MSDESKVKVVKSKDEFDAHIASGKVVLVDFYADWCGPCRMISPEFEKLAKEHAAKEGVEFYKVDIDNIPELAQALGISSIPTFHAYKDSIRIDKVIGANKAALSTFVRNGVGRA